MANGSTTHIDTTLRRDTANSVWAGVAAGVARRIDLAPWLVRLAFIIASLFGGIGLLLYVAGWVLIPADGEDDALLERWIRDGDRTNWAGVVLIGIAAVTLLGSVRFLDGEVVFAVALLVVGILLYRGTFDDRTPADRDSDGDTGGGEPEAGTSGEEAGLAGLIAESGTTAEAPSVAVDLHARDERDLASPSVGEPSKEADTSDEADPAGPADDDRLQESDDEAILAAAGMAPPLDDSPATASAVARDRDPMAGLPPEAPTPARVPTPARPPTPRSILGRVTIAAVMIVLGALAVLDNWFASLGATEYLAAAVLVIGAGLLVGAWWGRARVTILLGLFLLALMQMTAWFEVPLTGGIGDPVYTIESVEDLGGEYRLLAGELTIDLRQLRFVGEQRIEASVAAGHLVVRLPEDTNIDVRASAVGGDLNVLGLHESGADTSVRRQISVDDAGGTLILDLEVGFGQIDADRSGG